MSCLSSGIKFEITNNTDVTFDITFEKPINGEWVNSMPSQISKGGTISVKVSIDVM